MTVKQVQPARHPKVPRYAKHTTLQSKTRQSPAAKLKASTRRTAKNLALSATIRRHKTPRSQLARVKATTLTAPIRLAQYATLRLKTPQSPAVRRSKSLPQTYLFQEEDGALPAQMCEQGVSFVAEQELGISPLLLAILSTFLRGRINLYWSQLFNP